MDRYRKTCDRPQAEINEMRKGLYIGDTINQEQYSNLKAAISQTEVEIHRQNQQLVDHREQLTKQSNTINQQTETINHHTDAIQTLRAELAALRPTIEAVLDDPRLDEAFGHIELDRAVLRDYPENFGNSRTFEEYYGITVEEYDSGAYDTVKEVLEWRFKAKYEWKGGRGRLDRSQFYCVMVAAKRVVERIQKGEMEDLEWVRYDAVRKIAFVYPAAALPPPVGLRPIGAGITKW